MKNFYDSLKYPYWVVVFTLLAHSITHACTGDITCEARPYGHRRAYISAPRITLSTADKGNIEHDFRSTFQDISREAEKLRSHLIKTEALLPLDNDYEIENPEEETFVRQFAHFICGKVKKSKEITDDTVEGYVTTYSVDIQKLFISAFELEAETPEFSEIMKRERWPFLKIAAQNFAKKIKDNERDQEWDSRNLAALGYVFFDQEGKRLNQNPYFFSPQATPDTLEKCYFFLSGRQYHASPRDAPWTALPAHAPKASDLDTLPSEETLGDVSQKIKKSLRGNQAAFQKKQSDTFKRFIRGSAIKLSKPFITKVHKTLFLILSIVAQRKGFLKMQSV